MIYFDKNQIAVSDIQRRCWFRCFVRFTVAADFGGHSFTGSSPVRLIRSSEFKLTAPVEELVDFPSHLSWSSPLDSPPSLSLRIPHSHTGPLSAVPVPGLGVACTEAGATVGAFRGTCRWDKGPRVLGLKTD